MRLPRLSLPFLASAALVPMVAFAAPAQSVSELFQRFSASDETRRFSVETSIADAMGGTTIVTVRGKMQGQGGTAIAHGIVEVTSGTDTMRLRMAMIEETLYLKLSKAGGSADFMDMDDDLGVEPWLAIPLNAQMAMDGLPEGMPGLISGGMMIGDQQLPSELIDSLLTITSAISDGKGGTTYTVELADRPVLALAQTFGGMMFMGEELDLESDLDIRRLDGWVRDTVRFLAHFNENAAGALGTSDINLGITSEETGMISISITTTTDAQFFTLVKPLLTVSLDELMAEQSLPPSWDFIAPVEDTSWREGDADCTLAGMRRGLCGDLYQSRRTLGQ